MRSEDMQIAPTRSNDSKPTTPAQRVQELAAQIAHERERLQDHINQLARELRDARALLASMPKPPGKRQRKAKAAKDGKP